MMELSFSKQNTKESLRKRNWGKLIIQNRYLYLLMLPAMIYLLMIDYRAMYGIVLAFKDFNARLGIMGSPWIGF